MDTATLLLTPEEAARALRLGRTTIYALMRANELPSVRVGAARRIPRAALDAWIADRLAAEGHGPPAGAR
jgi:excisionase family DNA binding protein